MYLQEPLQHWGMDTHCPVRRGGNHNNKSPGRALRVGFGREEMKNYRTGITCWISYQALIPVGLKGVY